MYLCMRTTIDMPDKLMSRVKCVIAQRKITFRSLVIDALENSLNEDNPLFVLRDASAGYNVERKSSVATKTINRAIDENRGG